jgi:hypothetical protein
MKVTYSRHDGGWVAIEDNEDEYFLQGDEAYKLINRADDIADLRGVPEQEALQVASRELGY